MHRVLFLLLNSTIAALAAPAATSATSANPADCTAAYVTVNGKHAAVQCGVDHPGGDYKSASASSLQACETICATDSGQCLTAQYAPARKTCYLKDGVHAGVHKTTTNSIIFYTRFTPVPIPPNDTSKGCASAAPPNPWLLNGGFENGFQDTEGPGYGSTGSGAVILNNVAFEGCKSYSIYPTTAAVSGNTRYTSFGIDYFGLSVGGQYNFTLTFGRPTPNITNYTAPLVQAIMQNGIYYWDHLCGAKDTPPCTVVGTGGARGQTTVPQFTAQTTSGILYFRIYWTDVGNDTVLLDDVRIQPM